MNHPAWYASAGHQPPTVCLKLKLQPYTIGADILLYKHGSAFVTGEPAGFSDLLLGCLICSLPFDEAEKVLNSWRLPVFCKIWSFVVGKKIDLAQEAQTFRDYYTFGSWFPDVNIPVDGKDFASPPSVRLLAEMMNKFHIPQKEALAMPRRWASCLYSAHAEAKGEAELFTEGTKSQFEMARQKLKEADEKPELWNFGEN
jgi:hypothetical protein